MDNYLAKRNKKRAKRVLRVRRGIQGSAVSPRLCVLKTNKHISAQLIDDDNSVTLVSAGTMHNDFKKGAHNGKSKAAAREVGKKLAQMALSKDIKTVIFDRGRFKYHGVIAELAEGAREQGLQF